MYSRFTAVFDPFDNESMSHMLFFVIRKPRHPERVTGDRDSTTRTQFFTPFADRLGDTSDTSPVRTEAGEALDRFFSRSRWQVDHHTGVDVLDGTKTPAMRERSSDVDDTGLRQQQRDSVPYTVEVRRIDAVEQVGTRSKRSHFLH
ncbi:MAG TPA: hypothetical protein VFG15_02600 [Amycolatopsis sp.]|nr:hypothetical protein [Amycolatopsis sp.]